MVKLIAQARHYLLYVHTAAFHVAIIGHMRHTTCLLENSIRFQSRLPCLLSLQLDIQPCPPIGILLGCVLLYYLPVAQTWMFSYLHVVYSLVCCGHFITSLLQ